MYRIITFLFSTTLLFRPNNGEYSGYYVKLSESTAGSSADTACLDEFGTNAATIHTQEDNERASALCGAGEQCFIGLKRDRDGNAWYWGTDNEYASSTYNDYPHFWAQYEPDNTAKTPTMELYKNQHQSSYMCDIPLHTTATYNMKSYGNCENDQAESLRIVRADAGTLITIYDTSPASTSDDYLVIDVQEDIYPNKPYNSLFTLETNRNDRVRATYYDKGNLNGKVSTVKVREAPYRKYVAINGDDSNNWYDVKSLASPVICNRPDYCANVTCVNNACQTGECNAATGVCDYDITDCNDLKNCTHDSCDPDTGCNNIPIDCSDGNVCNGEEYCEAATGHCKDAADLVCEAGFECNIVKNGCVRDCDLFAIDGYLRDCSLEFNNNEFELGELVGRADILEDRVNKHDNKLDTLTANISLLQNEDDLIYDQIGFVEDDVKVLEQKVETIYNVLGEYKTMDDEMKESVYSQLEALSSRLNAFIPLPKYDESNGYQGPGENGENGENGDGQMIVGLPILDYYMVKLLLVSNMVLFVALIGMIVYYCKNRKEENQYQRVKYASASDA